VSEDNNTKRCRLIPAAGLALCLSLFGLVDLASSQEEPTPTEPNMVSLFRDDPCFPPCWFGLIPGESRLEDVVNMFYRYDDLFSVNPRLTKTGRFFEWVANMEPLLHGQGVEFVLLQWYRDDILRFPNQVGITDKVLTRIYVISNENVSLEDALSQLGRPFVMRAFYDLYTVNLIFFYPDEKLIVSLEGDRYECKTNRMMQNFEVLDLAYLSEEAYLGLSEFYSITPYVPHQLFDDWISGEIGGSCFNAIKALIDATP
jgi:hypothetical protein